MGRQVATDFGGFVDLLGLDAEGRVQVLELKRDRSPRDVVAQLLDYGAWARGLTLDDLEGLCGTEIRLTDAFAERFGTALPDVINTGQQLTVVASSLDPTSARIVEYLAEQYGVPINAVFFRYFTDADRRYLARSWLISPQEQAQAVKRAGKSQPWNGRDFYVVLGRAEHGNRWEPCRKYGFVSAGGGPWYWKPLRNLLPGHRVFAYVGGIGYVGIGEVTGTLLPLEELTVEDANGSAIKIIDQPEMPAWMRELVARPDPDDREYAVPVEWLVSRPLGEAVQATGLFASQVSACRLSDERTIRVVTNALGVET